MVAALRATRLKVESFQLFLGEEIESIVGSTCFILSEIYETDAGVADHFQMSKSSGKDFPALVKWMEKCKVTVLPAVSIINSLW